MKAVILKAINQLEIGEAPRPEPKAGEVRVAIKAAALNRRDYWIKAGQYAGLKFPTIPGSDGAGIVDAVGAGVDGTWLGQEVILNPSLSWGASQASQGANFNILGLPRDGTLAEYVTVPAEQLAAKPKELSWEEAAALPLAGLTAYRVLVSRAQVKAGETVLVTGIGGGVALFVLQFARALGAQTWVTSSSGDKITRAAKWGAQGGFNYKEQGWVDQAKKAVGGFDVIIDSAGGPGFNDLLDLAKPGARLGFFGGTAGAVPEFQLRRVFWKQLSLLGSTMGSPDDWAAMIDCVRHHHIKPVISEVVALNDVTTAFERLEHSSQFGKLVVSIAS